MSQRPAMSSDDPRELRALVDDLRKVLADTRAGALDVRWDEALPEGHPLSGLRQDINALIEALAVERRRSLDYVERVEDQRATIELQRAALRELSTPVIEVWRGVLCFPVVGVMDSERSAQMMSELLQAVAERAADHVIIDVTGIHAMDGQALGSLVAAASALRLLGAECVITGIKPLVADALVEMDFDPSVLSTRRNLRDALRHIIASKRVA
ncbi:STAS domain-containing protein [Sorangium sp. So ce388]|uniref:STAS domain-containing protein n=1 Tax=Sorangium sp. So ce388 TaxID=3133309 RepID=UPI003F5B949B